jgi:hypothetical protein
MEHTKYFQCVFKEGEIINMKLQKCHVREPPRACSGDHAGLGTLKITKQIFFGTFLGEHMYDRCCTFVVTDSVIFSKPLLCCPSGPNGTLKPQFEDHLGTNWITFWVNVEKWKLRSRSREDTKSEFSRPWGSVCQYDSSFVDACYRNL